MSGGRIRYNSYGVPIPPKNYLTESILATLFCCLPFGVVGLVNASKVESFYNKGLYAEAERASANAWKWTRYSFIAALIGWIIVFLLYFVFPFLYIALIGALALGASATDKV